MQPEWWENFFQGMFVDLWRDAVPAEHTRAEVDFVEKSPELSPGSKVLDAPCGHGRHTLEFASRGYRMTGVDYSPAFLDMARTEAARRKLDVTWERRDMRELPWQDEFDGAFCIGGSFAYFTDEGNAAFVNSVAHALKPGGRFALDATRVAEFILPRHRDREWTQVGEYFFLEENHYDHVQGRMQTEYTLVRDGKMEKKSDSVRIYTFREIDRLLADAGFSNREAFGSFEREPYRLGSPLLYLVASKA
ncbi:MAG: cyclopropane-fatty-acyl-phospholipid synthase family protein [Terriglobia bacterium]